MNDFLKAYTTKEVVEMIDVPGGTIRQWERDFNDVLVIPRDSNNARYYTDFEIETLKHIKAMREKNVSKQMIRELLEKNSEEGDNEENKSLQPAIHQMQQSEAVEALRNIQNMPEEFQKMFDRMASEMKKEVREEIRNELSNRSQQEQKQLENSDKHASEQIESLARAFEEREEMYKKEIERRDEMLEENNRLLHELNKEKKKTFFQKMFGV